MKRFAISILPALFILALFSCDEVKVEELADIDFNTTLTKSLHVDVTSTNEMTSSIVLDATADPEIKKYADNIKNYEITELLFAIENYQADTEDEIYFDGNIGFSKKSENQATSSCSISFLNVTHWAGTGDFPISTCNDIMNGISALFTADNAVKIYMTGTFTGAPLSFDLKVTAKVKVTANPS
ncbi:MAG: hypothetical protein KAR17_15120 [Cyclobacteriaceae bacterium]|nr:hypothetical protein [Cyclobacteriaceae bacterium]